MNDESVRLFHQLYCAALTGIMSNQVAMETMKDDDIADRAGTVALAGLVMVQRLTEPPPEVITQPVRVVPQRGRMVPMPPPPAAGAVPVNAQVLGTNVQTGPVDDLNTCQSCGMAFNAMPGKNCKWGIQHTMGMGEATPGA